MNEQNTNQLKQGEEDYKKHVTIYTEFKNSIKQNETILLRFIYIHS